MSALELLAPAGSIDILKKAVDCGADAVYCGLAGEHNARGNAVNLSLSELKEGVDYAHLRNSKVYLTCNTLLSDSELESYLPVLTECANLGVDAFIIQDIGLLKLVNRYIGIPVNASTQMNVFGTSEYAALKELGVKRIVLPRELTMSEIACRTETAKEIGLETEVFCHGAICICQSGLCLYSAMNRSGTRSGNRGLCAQPCREEYKLRYEDKIIRKGHLISPKDRDISGYIKDLIVSGVASVKIEGRMRDADYVANTVSLYRRLIDETFSGYDTSDIKEEAYNGLLINFNRGGSFSSQNMSGVKDPDLLSGEFPGKYGLKIGRVSDTSSYEGIISVRLNDKTVKPSSSDVISIRSDDIQVCSFPAGKIADNGKSLDIKGLHPDTIKKVKAGMDVFLMSHKFDSSDLRKTMADMTVKVEDDMINLIARFNISGHNIEVESSAEMPSDYENVLPEERVVSQLSKLGSTPFIAGKIDVSGDIRCPVSLINNLRRSVCEKAEEKITSLFERNIAIEDPDLSSPYIASSLHNVIKMHTYTHIKGSASVIKPGADLYQIPVSELISDSRRKEIVDIIDSYGAGLVVQMPGLIHDEQKERYERVLTALKDKCYAVSSSEKLSSGIYSGRVFLSAEGNVYNRVSYEMVSSSFDAMSLSYELTCDDVTDIVSSSSGSAAIIVQKEGPVIWMQSDFCPVGRNMSACNMCKNKRVYELIQNNNEIRYVVTDPTQCSSRIYGPLKNIWKDEDIERLSRYADVIVNYTFI